ncbi:MAG: hypothetical protein ABIO60_00745 [Aquaticitalea sp.]
MSAKFDVQRNESIRQKKFIWDLESGIWNLGFGIWDLGFGIWDLESRIWDLGFGTWKKNIYLIFI